MLGALGVGHMAVCAAALVVSAPRFARTEPAEPEEEGGHEGDGEGEGGTGRGEATAASEDSPDKQ